VVTSVPLVAKIVSTVISELPVGVPLVDCELTNTTIKSVQRSGFTGRVLGSRPRIRLQCHVGRVL
jgi:hypothetical protein